jgi:hypothetical protein
MMFADTPRPGQDTGQTSGRRKPQSDSATQMRRGALRRGSCRTGYSGWLEVSPDEQTRRLESRINDPRKVWKLSGMDLKSYGRWFDYSRARDDMFRATDTSWAPWYVAHTDDKKRGRLDIISRLLSQIPYEPLAPRDVKLPAAASWSASMSVALETMRLAALMLAATWSARFVS